jgi:two-component system, response regulator, stage 0 sporulation protein A
MTDIIKILIVDDNKDLTELLEISLSKYSDIHVVETVHSGIKALQMLQSKSIDIVLLDIIMPEMDGMELLRRMKALGLTTPSVILLSAIGSNALISQALDLGAESALQKPVDIHTIIAEIRNVYQRKHRPSIQ